MLGDGKVGHIDTRDVAEVAATVLTGDGHQGKIYPLTGPESLSMTEVAGALSSALGKEVRYVNVASDQVKAAILGMGAPEFVADALLELYMMISQGMADMVVGTFQEITGHDPRGFGEFAHDFASSFEGTSS